MIAPIAKMPEIIELARQAGGIIMQHYMTGTEVWDKDDRSPVTAADREAEAVILAGLRAMDPAIPIIAEEEVSLNGPPEIDGPAFWLVDPLDGTREFLSRNGEFTVNIALIVDRAPLLGVVHAPALNESWWGAKGQGAVYSDGVSTQDIATRAWPENQAVAVASRSHRDETTNLWLQKQNITETRSAGSSLKLCLVAQGLADVYPRFGRTMEWDIAAGDGVLRAAGGLLTTSDGQTMLYEKAPVFDNPAFIAWGDPSQIVARS